MLSVKLLSSKAHKKLLLYSQILLTKKASKPTTVKVSAQTTLLFGSCSLGLILSDTVLAARVAAGAAMETANSLRKDITRAIAVVRPPGHHAGPEMEAGR